MPRERLSMRKVHEVLRLTWEAKLSNRAIARSCGISHSTVREYLHRAEQAGIRWPMPEGLDEDQLYQLLFPKPAPPWRRALPEPDWKYIHAELKRKGVTRRLLWLEYREAHPDGYGYSRFCELYRLWARKLDRPMRLTHFAATLAASSYTYAEAQWAEDLSSWIGGHVRALAFFGGVPLSGPPSASCAGRSRSALRPAT